MNTNKIICDMMLASQMRLIDQEDVVAFVDAYILDHDDFPYEYIRIALHESFDPAAVDGSYQPDDATVAYLLNLVVTKWQHDEDDSRLIGHLSDLWYDHRPLVMYGFYLFDESVSPHSGRQVSDAETRNAIHQYLRIMRRNGLDILIDHDQTTSTDPVGVAL